MKPNYLCIGVQKAGTNSLINYLNYHPQIFACPSELSVFTRALSHGELTTEDIKCYEDKLVTEKKIIGEKCACYSVLQYALDRIYNYDKNMKLIIILREPILRAFSEYNMLLPSYPQYMNDTDDQILDLFKTQALYKLSELTHNSPYLIIRGYYDEILEYILSKFPRENLYIGISEEIANDKLKYYNEIYEFLGATKLKNIDENLDDNIGNYIKKLPKSLEKYLYTIYKPHNEKLYEILGRKINIWENYYDELKTYMD